MLKAFVRQLMRRGVSSKQYWTAHNVTLHKGFSSAQESLEYFHWRNDQYYRYIDLMPVTGMDGKIVLDYGCGPGNDLVGFGVYSSPAKLIGVDISTSSLAEASARLALHGIDADLICASNNLTALPFDSCSIDHIHSSGVLHHTADPVELLKEFRRVLRPDGTINVMVYNRDSLWMHLYVAYQRNIVQNLYPCESIADQFRHSTDGENCPISNCYSASEWIEICRSAGLTAKLSGVAVSMHEMTLLPLRYLAVQNQSLPSESRRFLCNLTFDQCGYPLHEGVHAGIDACFQLRKAE